MKIKKKRKRAVWEKREGEGERLLDCKRYCLALCTRAVSSARADVVSVFTWRGNRFIARVSIVAE